MAKIPIKFKRVAAAFDEAAKWRPCDGNSSGSEYWPATPSGADLSDLVNSFIEKGEYAWVDHSFDLDDVIDTDDVDANWVSDNDERDENNTEREELLQSLLLECRSSKSNEKEKIKDEINVALRLFGGCNNGVNVASRSSLKRNLMAHLREKGFDAGLCKSRWGKTGRFPAGSYEYIDVNVGKTRYIIEVFLAGEFDIARPTKRYSTLLEMIPSILIMEKPKVLKQILGLMSAAMKDSLKNAGMHVAPWRRNGYMQAKYISPYKRTTNRESNAKDLKGIGEGLVKKRSTIGFESNQLPRASYYCRDGDFGSKGNGVRIGLLATVLQGK